MEKEDCMGMEHGGEGVGDGEDAGEGVEDSQYDGEGLEMVKMMGREWKLVGRE